MTSSLGRRVAITMLCLLGSASLVQCDVKSGATALAGTASFDVGLSNMALSAGTLTPLFDPATTSYTATVANGTTSLTITPTAPSITEVIKVNGTVVNSGTASATISIPVGTTRVTVLVTGEDGRTTRTYSIDVARAAVANP